MSEIKNTQKDNAKDTDVVIPMFNYSKTSGSLWQHYRDEPLLNSNVAIIDFPVNNNDNILVKLKTKKDGKAGNGGIMMLK